MRRALLLMAAALAVGGCGSAATPRATAPPAPVASPVVSPGATAGPSTTAAPPEVPAARTASTPTPAAPPVSPAWRVGASPLPLRADGFGQVLTTPALLRDRRMTAASTLPSPPDGRFTATVAPVSREVRQRMGESWSAACPVALVDLRYLTVSFRGFDGAAHSGELVVNARVADDVVEVFRRLFAVDFPIEEMRLPTTADLRAAPTGDGNNTASYVCRAARGQKTWSQHAYGLAVDVNPFQNPLVRRDLVVPELASAYARRGDVRPGMHLRAGPAVRAFAAVGWQWGGAWRSSKDYMHFSQNGQ